ncbi:hypothetical protein P7228_08965 [Altererythrobacter arenosus]|uniref:DUF3800 domain-containing protein n=1 Tax=Altererythrobacter arenosus TaxID=3032592 RepID=A0ABY8FMY0_9SPHN|nr:DUF3800 domain-containing protein [Altererythrobacter sp. CAU 1644]WFL76132.1 hypothetical protein P7228_08965 [Altererythrobacter sp. CAU 1644]
MTNTKIEKLQPPVTFFGDASSKNSAYMVAGGFAVSAPRIQEIEATIASLRELIGGKEFHWADYKGGPSRAAYSVLVQYAFELVHNGHAAFHAIITPFKGYRHKRSPGENKDTSVNRMYFQLLLHRPARFYGPKRDIHVRLDAGADSQDICRMRNELCATAYEKYRTRPNCIKSLQSYPSHQSGIIQMADVVLGGIAAKRNGIKHTTEKAALADLIQKKSKHPAWEIDTGRNARNLTIWNFKGSKE